MFCDRLPYGRLIVLADLSDTLTADVDALEKLAIFSLREDTGGLVHREIASAFVSRGRLDRLHRAHLLHDHTDLHWCRCGVRSHPSFWSLHGPVLTAAGW